MALSGRAYDRPMLDARIKNIAEAIVASGGRPVAVGGFVRDLCLGIDAKDMDIEVFGLALEDLEGVLARFGRVRRVGRAFGVLRLDGNGVHVEFSLPRRDSKRGPGHRGFDVEVHPELDFAEAARRRDLTINSMGMELPGGAILDPHGGRRDLELRILRATDTATFSEDPLRGLRVAQFCARLDMTPNEELVLLCGQLDLAEISPERKREELHKLLLRGVRPSLGLAFLRHCGLLVHFPELAALVDVPQDALWHPEGDVWTHTLMVVDEAAMLRTGVGNDDDALMFGALCHDFGKPLVTHTASDGRVRSPGHSEAGIAPTRTFLDNLRTSQTLVRRTCALVRHHLAPAQFVAQGAGDRAYRRLARRLAADGVSMELLVRTARADHFGRTTKAALARSFPEGDRFLARARALSVADRSPPNAVLGRHLIARGLKPGPEFSDVLRRCRVVQDAHGWNDPDRVLDAVLGTALASQTAPDTTGPQ